MIEPKAMRTAAMLLFGVLAAQAVAYHTLGRNERDLPTSELARFPSAFGSWLQLQEFPLDPEVQKVLRADQTLNRSYAGTAARVPVNLFVAFFKTQKTGVAPHSPKNCLPGAGWTPSSSGTIDIAVGGNGSGIKVNRYVVSRGDEKTLVLYWYQTPFRVEASEYMAKIWLVLDSIRHNRSDTALVRVVVPVVGGDENKAEKLAIDFVQSALPNLTGVLPAA
jgi:EpsI family protein